MAKKYIEKIQLPNGNTYKINVVPAGGELGQVLTKSGEDREALQWVTPEVYDDTEVVQDIEALELTKADKSEVYTKEELFTKEEVTAEIEAVMTWKEIGK